MFNQSHGLRRVAKFPQYLFMIFILIALSSGFSTPSWAISTSQEMVGDTARSYNFELSDDRTTDERDFGDHCAGLIRQYGADSGLTSDINDRQAAALALGIILGVRISLPSGVKSVGRGSVATSGVHTELATWMPRTRQAERRGYVDYARCRSQQQEKILNQLRWLR